MHRGLINVFSACCLFQGSNALAAAAETASAPGALQLDRARAIRETVASQVVCSVVLGSCPKTPLRDLLPEPDEWLKGTRGQLVV
jgi:hypothetical protein